MLLAARVHAGVAIAAALVLVSGCGSEPPTEAEATRAVDDLANPADGEFAHGSFDFSDQLGSKPARRDGRLTSTSWDVYYVLDDGDVGAWGAGLDVFDSADAAAAAADLLATFWVCDGPREPVSLEADGYDVLEASTCKRPSEDGYYATLSAADGVVTANLTLASYDREVAEAALVAVWGSLSERTQDVVEDLD